MKIYTYRDYDHYVEMQTEANKKKIDWRYVKPETVKRIVDHFRKNFDGDPKAIICHGTRNGGEQQFFQGHFPNAEIVGTEISETAEQFPMTVQWDFTKQKDEWIGKHDIVYSNSFDHSIDPEETLRVWTEQLTPNGILYIEYSEQQSESSAYDPLDATNKEVVKMIRDKGFKVEVKPGKRSGHLIFMCTQE